MTHFILFAFINALIFIAYYLLSFRQEIPRVSGRFVFALTLYLAQIILTQLLLCIFRQFYLTWLIVANIIISLSVVVLALKKTGSLQPMLLNEIRLIRNAFTSILTFENIFLSILFVFVAIWMWLAAFFLPPRDVDGMIYHIPEMIETVFHHRFFIDEFIEVTGRNFYAYPHNSELLFLWPLVFFRDMVFIQLVQFAVCLIGIMALYGLARLLMMSQRFSFFLSIQFLFIPVVLAQAGSTYNDLITAVFFIISLYFASHYYLNKSRLYLFMSGLSIGVMIGMKYTMLILAAWLHVLILPRLLKENYKNILIYILIIFLGGGYWYIKNLYLHHNPFFPVHFMNESFGVFKSRESFSLANTLSTLPRKFIWLYGADKGIGSLHGGFGLTFWGIAWLAWGYAFIQSLKGLIRKEFFHFCFWSQFLAGVFILAIIPMQQFHLHARYSLFMTALGLLALGPVFRLLDGKSAYRKLLIIICCTHSFLTVVILPRIGFPSYNLVPAIADIIARKDTVKNKYLRNSFALHPEYVPQWELMEFLTKGSRDSLSFYIGAEPNQFWTRPVYGNHLQNRIWNLQKGQTLPPDGFLYQLKEHPSLRMGNIYPLKDVFLDPAHDLILKTKGSVLLMRKDFLKQPHIRDKLIAYYKEYYGPKIDIIRQSAGLIEKDIPIITAVYWGHVFKYLNLLGAISNEVYICPNLLVDNLIYKYRIKQYYSFEKPRFDSYQSQVVFEYHIGEDNVKIYKNTRRVEFDG